MPRDVRFPYDRKYLLTPSGGRRATEEGKRGQALNCKFRVFCYQHDLDDSSKEELMSLG